MGYSGGEKLYVPRDSGGIGCFRFHPCPDFYPLFPWLDLKSARTLCEGSVLFGRLGANMMWINISISGVSAD